MARAKSKSSSTLGSSLLGAAVLALFAVLTVGKTVAVAREEAARTRLRSAIERIAYPQVDAWERNSEFVPLARLGYEEGEPVVPRVRLVRSEISRSHWYAEFEDEPTGRTCSFTYGLFTDVESLVAKACS